jgi:death-on-curing family protein
MHIANSDKPIALYGLDIILAVGYRTNSRRAIEFRRWATKTLRQYIVEGYTINKQRIAQNYQQFLEAVATVKQLLPPGTPIDATSVLELVNLFADTWFSLDAYDKGTLITKGATKKRVMLTAQKLEESLVKLKTVLTEKGETTEHFGIERNPESIAGIVGNVMQSFGGKELYGSVEEKAAHLLYFVVKNHPFVDGNKRSGAYAFIWFLRQANILDATRLTAPALTALTILVAESNPKDKEKVIGLILTLIAKKGK